MTQNQSADITWIDGDTPVATRFDDPYFSRQNGQAETEHVFLAGNDLPARFVDGFQIAELGFGTGLNLLTTCAAWAANGTRGKLHFTSFEAFPMTPPDIARALKAFPDLSRDAATMIDALARHQSQFAIGPVQVSILLGDARGTLPDWKTRADAWFLDGFAPATNPELWTPDLMQSVADHTQPNGTFATYTAAGAVRRALSTAGFDVTRQAGYGRKRHMTTGRLRA